MIDSGRSYLCSLCLYAPSYLEYFFLNSSLEPSDLKEIYKGDTLMFYLSASGYVFRRDLWDFFPIDLNESTILELVKRQSEFLRRVILSDYSRSVISKYSSSLLTFLDIRFKKTFKNDAVDVSFITTEFDPVDRTCSLHWIEEFKLNVPKIPKSDMEKYKTTIKPMITLRKTGLLQGSGATSKLYKCYYNDSLLAVKVIAESSFASGKQEIYILKLIRNIPNICGMINHAVYSQSIKIVLPLFETDLLKLLNSSGILPVKSVLFVIYSILKALSSLSDLKIIHGDVKPANILLRRSQCKLKMEVALCDFGLSRELPEGKDFCTDPCYGTEAYLSPERHKKCFGPKTDVWSLGVVLHEMLYGCHPIIIDNRVQVPLHHHVPEVVQSILKDMLQSVETRTSAKRILKLYAWNKLMNDRWPELEDEKVGGFIQPRTCLAGPKDLDLFVSDNFLGKGAFGEVYKGTFKYKGKLRDVAVKKIPKSNLSFLVLGNKLGLKEIQQSQKIKRAKYLCRIYTYSEDLEYYYIAMEFCESNYRTYLTENKESDKIHIHLKQILEGVASLHKQRIVHRDMKPENILLTATDSIKIADFGLAKILEASFGTNSKVGTLFYKAPEVYSGRYGRSIDIWAVGIIYLEMLGVNIRKEFPKIQPPLHVLQEVVEESPSVRDSNGSSESEYDSFYSAGSAGVQCASSLDKYGNPRDEAFGAKGWIPELLKLVKASKFDKVIEEFLCSIFVPDDERPTAFSLLKNYKFTRDGIKRK